MHSSFGVFLALFSNLILVHFKKKMENILKFYNHSAGCIDSLIHVHVHVLTWYSVKHCHNSSTSNDFYVSNYIYINKSYPSNKWQSLFLRFMIQAILTVQGHFLHYYMYMYMLCCIYCYYVKPRAQHACRLKYMHQLLLKA